MDKKINNHIVSAIATYICLEASKNDVFTRQIDTSNVCELYGATAEEQEEAYTKARKILKDFMSYNPLLFKWGYE